ncbi:hypothetical protein DQ04_22901010, partial [Trypanosoma grayi]|uniref:hypothetical protein n=1 Tax=Trypanosoma grayi TaxID=71804 RepID=UPI0004F434B1
MQQLSISLSFPSHPTPSLTLFLSLLISLFTLRPRTHTFEYVCVCLPATPQNTLAKQDTSAERPATHRSRHTPGAMRRFDNLDDRVDALLRRIAKSAERRDH